MNTALVVDDSLTEREIITHYLTKAGIIVSTAQSGEEALEKLELSLPDVIVLDVVLPGLSGFEICRALKAEDKTKKIPVILCSTKKSKMDEFWGLKQGADAYIFKPVDPDLLLHTVKKLIEA